MIYLSFNCENERKIENELNLAKVYQIFYEGLLQTVKFFSKFLADFQQVSR